MRKSNKTIRTSKQGSVYNVRNVISTYLSEKKNNVQQHNVQACNEEQ